MRGKERKGQALLLVNRRALSHSITLSSQSKAASPERPRTSAERRDVVIHCQCLQGSEQLCLIKSLNSISEYSKHPSFQWQVHSL